MFISFLTGGNGQEFIQFGGVVILASRERAADMRVHAHEISWQRFRGRDVHTNRRHNR